MQGAIPAPLNYAPPGYTPYPKSICTSVNHQVCHGIPNDRALKNGDIVNIDVTVIKDGWHGDTSRMFVVGEGSIAAKRLCTLTYEAMWKGIVMVKPGARLGDIGHQIQKFAESQGFSVVREFCGHGIGRKFHEEPQVLHYGRPGTLEELVPGMVFTIEPMINAGRREIRELGDGWTIVTRDRSLSAQWEHTVAVTETGYEVLTAVGRQPGAAGVCRRRGRAGNGHRGHLRAPLVARSSRAVMSAQLNEIPRCGRRIAAHVVPRRQGRAGAAFHAGARRRAGRRAAHARAGAACRRRADRAVAAQRACRPARR